MTSQGSAIFAIYSDKSMLVSSVSLQSTGVFGARYLCGVCWVTSASIRAAKWWTWPVTGPELAGLSVVVLG